MRTIAAELRLHALLARDAAVSECRQQHARLWALLERDVAARRTLARVYARKIRDDEESARADRAADAIERRWRRTHRGTLPFETPLLRAVATPPPGAPVPTRRVVHRAPAGLGCSQAQRDALAEEGVAQQFFRFRAIDELRAIKRQQDDRSDVQIASSGRGHLLCIDVVSNAVVWINTASEKREPQLVSSSLAHYNAIIDHLVGHYPFTRRRDHVGASVAGRRLRAALATIDPAAASAWEDFVADVEMGDFAPQLW